MHKPSAGRKRRRAFPHWWLAFNLSASEIELLIQRFRKAKVSTCNVTFFFRFFEELVRRK